MTRVSLGGWHNKANHCVLEDGRRRAMESGVNSLILIEHFFVSFPFGIVVLHWSVNQSISFPLFLPLFLPPFLPSFFLMISRWTWLFLFVTKPTEMFFLCFSFFFVVPGDPHVRTGWLRPFLGKFSNHFLSLIWRLSFFRIFNDVVSFLFFSFLKWLLFYCWYTFRNLIFYEFIDEKTLLEG